MKSHNLKAALAASALQNYQQTTSYKPSVKKERSDLSMVMAYLTDPETRKHFNVSIEDLRNDKTSKIFKGKKYQELSDDEKQKVDQVIDGIRAKIFKAFACETPEAKAKLRSYLETNETEGIIGKFLFGEEFKSQFSSKEEELKNQFAELEKKYSHGHKFEDFQKIHTAINFVDQVVEGNIQTETPERAYKAMAIFWEKDASQTAKNINEFIKSFTSKYPNPVHDMFMDALPKGINQGAWLKLIKQNGTEVLKKLPNAAEIQKNEDALKDIVTFRAAIQALKYPRQQENPKLAELYSFYEVGNGTFERTLELMKEGQPLAKIKKEDTLPVAEHKLEGTTKNLWFMKLPAGDPRGLILGKITNCCQSINGNSERCVIDGMTKPNNGFYVLVELPKGKEPKDIKWETFEKGGNKILGQCYAWKSKSGNLTFDSWENLNPNANDIDVVSNLPAFAEKLIEADNDISRITLGLGGKTPAILSSIITPTDPETIQDGFFYGDSLNQIEIEITKELAKLRSQINQLFPDAKVDICSIKQAKYILAHQKDFKSTPEEFQWIYSKLSFELGEENVAILAKELSKDQGSQLISAHAKQAYMTGKISPQDLVDLAPEKIQLLLSYPATEAYKNNKVSTADLKDLELEKIRLLISSDAIKAYETGHVSAADLKDLELEKIQLLVSYPATEAYKANKVSAADLKGFELEKIQILISYDARKGYMTRKVSAADLKDLELEKIRLLISSDAIKAYETGHVSAADLKDLSEERIDLLISSEALWVYLTVGITAQVLKKYTAPEIKLLISDEAIEEYQKPNANVGKIMDAILWKNKSYSERFLSTASDVISTILSVPKLPKVISHMSFDSQIKKTETRANQISKGRE